MRKTIAASEAIRKANRRLSESQAGPLRACQLQDHYYPLRTFGRPSSSLWKPERCRNFAPTKVDGLPHQRYRRLSGALDLYALSQELAKFFDQSGTRCITREAILRDIVNDDEGEDAHCGRPQRP